MQLTFALMKHLTYPLQLSSKALGQSTGKRFKGATGKRVERSKTRSIIHTHEVQYRSCHARVQARGSILWPAVLLVG